ncbi:probable protein phosphatase 2C 65 [Nicotiana sylvestris]|uniref:Probable protein phosphatase 2C 65 n=1 Tax=Nicotiana sylvestris TaxID=4096 RepID=A0A1U7YPS8_NICSY|nr:PREDICTED: probable protein phosphatase 2C 65 [Nicotiana sylvestris]XP_016476621.1 PREDICTED: probable protein phosphatase 2C 65 [Nicotiana tabacum]
MGACCTCQRGQNFEGKHHNHNHNHNHHNYYEENNGEQKEIEDDYQSIVGRGDLGANVRLCGFSKFVSMYSQQGKKGINQDAMTVWENFGGQKGMFFCGVFDGHGPSGHKVARYVRDFLPSKISSYNNEISTNSIRWDVEKDDSEADNPYFVAWRDKFLKSFKEMDEELEGDGSIESYCSGTTAVTLVKQGEHLIVGNLGDSRAIICTRDDKNELVSEQLTVDLKPNLPAEYERIRSCEGRVMAMEEEPSVYRVWMPDQDCPGLAMARAFGDFCLKDFGLISVPEVYYRKLTEKDEFIVLASDGLWDVLSNDEVIRIVATARKRSIAARLVVHHAVRAWKYKYPCAKVDDCAVVCLFLKRQRPLLTKSLSEVTELSLNYTELVSSQNYTPNSKIDDGLDTLLNYQLKEEKDPNVVATGLNDGSGNDHNKSSSRHARYLSRRKSAMNF